MAMAVVFPAPLGPSSPTISPRSMNRLMPSTALTSLKCLVRSKVSSMGRILLSAGSTPVLFGPRPEAGHVEHIDHAQGNVAHVSQKEQQGVLGRGAVLRLESRQLDDGIQQQAGRPLEEEVHESVQEDDK